MGIMGISYICQPYGGFRNDGGVPQIIQVMDDQVVFETWFLWIRHDLRNPIA